MHRDARSEAVVADVAFVFPDRGQTRWVAFQVVGISICCRTACSTARPRKLVRVNAGRRLATAQLHTASTNFRPNPGRPALGGRAAPPKAGCTIVAERIGNALGLRAVGGLRSSKSVLFI